MKRFLGALAILLVVSLGAVVVHLFGQEFGDRKPVILERRLLLVGPGTMLEPIDVKVGEMIQVEPFSYPLTPKFLGAKIGVHLTGDQVVEVVGESSGGSSASEGRSRSSVFLYVRTPGLTSARLRLLDSDGRELQDFDAVYRISASVRR